MRNLQVLLLLLFFLNPLILSKYSFFENEFVKYWFAYMIVCLGWFIVGIYIYRGKKIPAFPRKISAITIIYINTFFLASLLGLSPKDSIIGRYGVWLNSFLSLLIYFSIYYFTFALTRINNRKFISNFFSVVICSAIIVVVRSLSDQGLLNTGNFFDLARISGPFKNPNHFGFYLSLIFIFTLSFALLSKERLVKYLCLVCSSIIAIALILTQSRSSWVVTFCTLVITFIIFRKSYIARFNRKFGFSAMLFLTVMLTIFFPVVQNRITGTFANNETRVSQQIRLKEWYTVLKIWQVKPYLGVGPENLDLIYPRFRDKSENLIPEEWKWRTLVVRNQWLEYLVTTGLFGIAVFLTFGFIIFYTGRGKNELVPFLSAIIAYYMNAFLYIPSVSSQILFFGLAGVVAGKTAINSKNRNTAISSLAGICISLFMVFLLYFLIRVIISEYKANQALHYLELDNQNDFAIAYKTTKEAYNLNPYFDKNLRLLILTTDELARKTDNTGIKMNLAQELLDDLELLKKKNTFDIENIKTLTSGYMRYAEIINASNDKSIQWGNRLIEIDPINPGSWDTLGIALLDSKNYESALKSFQYIINELKPDYPFAYFHIGETYRQMGQPDKSIPYYEKALQLGYQGAQREIDEAREEMRKSGK